MNHPQIIISNDPEETNDFGMFAAVINVADTPCQVFRANVPSFWFPIHETGRWGYAPFYGAAKVVDNFRDTGKPIMIHCHAGVNRSVSVAYAVMASDGLSDDQIIANQRLHHLWMTEAYQRNLKNGCIERDTLTFLIARHSYPTFSICGLLQAIKSPNLIHPTYKDDNTLQTTHQLHRTSPFS